MSTVSNRGLVFLILMTLTLSVFTTILSHERIGNLNEQLQFANIGTPSGFATASQSGTASINLTGSVAIILNVDTLNWGTGIVNQTSASCSTITLTTTGTTTSTLNPNECWINASGQTSAIMESDDFQIENVGTNSVNITINGTNSTNFFGWGTGATTNLMYRGQTSVGETDACGSSGADLITSWTEFDDESVYTNLCGSLNWSNSQDIIDVELNMSFDRSDVLAGEKTATIYFRAENATV